MRNGHVEVLPDVARYFQSIPDGYCDEFAALLNSHNAKFRDTLVNMSSVSTSAGSSSGGRTDTECEEDIIDGSGPSFDTVDQLKEAMGISHRTPSEVTGIDVLVCSKGGKTHTFLVNTGAAERVLPKNSHLGGYGQGQWMKAEDGHVGVKFDLPKGDKTTVQLDMSSVDPNQDKVQPMTLYAMLIMLEQKGLMVDHKMSYSRLARKAEAGSDKFEVNIPEKYVYRFLADSELPEALLKQKKASGKGSEVNAKNIFIHAHADANAWEKIGVVIRFRFEKVAKCLKAMKPYVITQTALKLLPGKPLEALRITHASADWLGIH